MIARASAHLASRLIRITPAAHHLQVGANNYRYRCVHATPKQRTSRSSADRGVGCILRVTQASLTSSGVMSATDPLPRREIGSSFLSFHPQPGVTTCLIILNHTLPHATARLWKHAAYKVCADGGSNRLYDSLPAMLGLASSSASGGSSSNGGGGGDAASAAAAAAAVAEARASHLPDVIVGDLDSLREVRRV
ncbi:hypothetical protein FOA52_004440 [Chlamydomonas sp. UWO 241]|nr:hypothetical protein FOA52_004440 [Chlamydomonas sp. UWO 241]